MKKNEIFKLGEDFGLNKDEIKQLIIKITGLSKSQLFLIDEINEKYKEKIKKTFIRFSNGEPIEYILENTDFYGLNFFVDSRVLIPRNDTEIMIDKTIEEIIKQKNNILIDIGTGSSCIAISIMKNTEKVKKCFVVDISKKALEVSKINIEKHRLKNKIKQLNGDLLNNFELDTKLLSKNGDLNIGNLIITANLPYIKNGDFTNMDKETIKFEPDLALYGGEKTGFELYEKLIYQCLELKSIYNINNLKLFIEIGFDQKEVSTNFLNKLGLQFEVFKDNGGIDRCIKIDF